MKLGVVITIWLAGGLSARDLARIPATSQEIADELTGVKVTVRIDEFLMAPAEVTQREWGAVMEHNPSAYKGDERPVENVSWWEAIRYANLRSVREGLEPCYDLTTGECDLTRNGYRLPTDAEWAHAAALPEKFPDDVGKFANLGNADTKDAGLLIQFIREKGTMPVASFPPNRYGLYDMTGNVWEWCGDLFNPANTPRTAANPTGAMWGVARVIRGGSFVSTISRWARGYRSSMEPDYRSRFTGFRVCRSVTRAAPVRTAEADAKWLDTFNRPPAGFENATGPLSPLTEGVASAAEWKARKEALRAKWRKLLGAPDIAPPAPRARLVRTFEEQNYTGKLMYLQVEPDHWEKILLMAPARRITRPLPVVIVPYYDVDTPAGTNMGGRSFMPPSVRSFAYMAAQQGFLAVAIRWFGESYAESYPEAVATLKMKHPNCTGLGKWVWDSQRLLDYLYTLPEVDRSRIGMIGHSLGGKMTLYATAMDDRITAAVSSELGIGLSFSNYDDYWYFGGFIGQWDKATDHHELLAMAAPRPFLLIGGDDSDNDKSWYYINAARKVYGLFGEPTHIGYFNHRKGHTPTPEAVQRSMEWLARFLE